MEQEVEERCNHPGCEERPTHVIATTLGPMRICTEHLEAIKRLRGILGGADE